MKQQPRDWCEFCGQICRFLFHSIFGFNLNVFQTPINQYYVCVFFLFCINFIDSLEVSISNCLTYTWPRRKQFRADIWALSQINCVTFFSSGKKHFSCFVLSEFRNTKHWNWNIELLRVFFWRRKEKTEERDFFLYQI